MAVERDRKAGIIKLHQSVYAEKVDRQFMIEAPNFTDPTLAPVKTLTLRYKIGKWLEKRRNEMVSFYQSDQQWAASGGWLI